MNGRHEVLAGLALRMVAIWPGHPLRVAVDGRCAAGKTTLAAELTLLAQAYGRPALHAGLDAYRIPWDQRDPADRDTGDGLYRKAWQLDSIRDELLLPLGPGGQRECTVREVEVEVDGRWVREARVTVPQDAVVIVDGVFALRPELNDCWDFRVYVDVDPAHTLERGPARALARDAAETARDDVPVGYHSRYLPSEELYAREVRPMTLADVIVDNRDLAAPKLSWRLAGDDRAR